MVFVENTTWCLEEIRRSPPEQRKFWLSLGKLSIGSRDVVSRHGEALPCRISCQYTCGV